MKCTDLAARIERLHPSADIRDVARLCLLLTNSVADINQLRDDVQLLNAWKDMDLRVQAATDQHAAMTADLEQLARSDPETLSPDQIWVLIRAIRVQGQILQLYLGHAPMDV